MTCKDKLAAMHPEWDVGEWCDKIENECPSDFGFLDDPDYCRPFTEACMRCWIREIPEEKTTESAPTTIKDSGSTTEFETGAHRDAREGKGRCDLLPLEVAAALLQGKGGEPDACLTYIREFQKTNKTQYLIACLMHFGVLSKAFKTIPNMLLEVAKHYEEGANKYGPDNWKKGMPVYIYIDSAVRHYLKWLRGDTDEPHDKAFVWNLMCCIWEVDHKEEQR